MTHRQCEVRMRQETPRESNSMAGNTELTIDRAQVKKAVQALQAFVKSKSSSDILLLDEAQHISLLFTLWKIPKQAQTIRIPLPHGQRSDTEDVCLFTRDEPNMTSEQTQRFYKKLLEERGVKNIAEIIPYKVLKTEYKPYEAKRRLLSNYHLFLSDDRVRRLLPSHLGKHFYERKKEPLCVNLKSKHLAGDIEKLVQGTNMKISNRGCCCMARVAHSDMTADDVTDNIEMAIKTFVAKLRAKGPMVKVIHLKTQASVALPIYTSDMSTLTVLEEALKSSKTPKDKKAAAKKQVNKKETQDVKQKDTTAVKKRVKEKRKAEKPRKDDDDDDDEEIPQLVPIKTLSKKPKVEKTSKKKQLEKPPKTAVVKKGTKGPKNKLTKKTSKSGKEGKRKVPKVK